MEKPGAGEGKAQPREKDKILESSLAGSAFRGSLIQFPRAAK